MPTRPISFAGSTLTIEYHGLEATRVVDFLYQNIAEGDSHTSQVTYHLHSSDSSGKLSLHRGERLLYEGDCAGTAAELLLGDSGYHLAAQCRTGLLFHAAALSSRGCTLILPGASGAGKSTLTAWLIAQGFDYLTDELVYIPWQTNTLQAFSRPLSLKPPARTLLSHLFDFEKQAAVRLSSPSADFIRPSLLRPIYVRNEAMLTLIVFPRYQANSPFESARLSKAQAGLALMQTLINARNLPDHGFTEITRLVRRPPAYTLRYSSFDQIAPWVKSLFDW